MKEYKKSRSSIFLLELLLNILLFSVLMIIGLNFFIKAHSLTNKTNVLHRAVSECNNVATLYESGEGSLDAICEIYSDAVATENSVTITLDKDKTITVEKKDPASPLNEATISYINKNEVIYKIEVCSFRQLSPSSTEVAHE